MTDTTADPAVAATPAPADRTALEGFLRDLYGIAAFYIAHPELPIPDYVTVSSRADTPERLLEIATALDTHVYGDLGLRFGGQCDIKLPSAADRTVSLIVTHRAGRAVRDSL